jgi:hypothetical protein
MVPNVRRTLAVTALLSVGCGRVHFVEVGDYASAVLADEPVAYYRLSELDGPVVSDASGHGHDAVAEAVGGVIVFGEPGAISRDPADSACPSR